jgi:hypothetical protein
MNLVLFAWTNARTRLRESVEPERPDLLTRLRRVWALPRMVVCAWCDRVIHDGVSHSITYGICERCRGLRLSKLERVIKEGR